MFAAPGSTSILRIKFLSLIPVFVLAVLLAAMPPDGKERSQWLLFAGKFHLLTIHFPIALIYLVPVLELVGRKERFSYLKSTVDFVLVLALLSSLFAASLGWALAWSGSYSGHIVTQHMWGGLLTATACWVCWFLRARMVNGQGSVPYALTLALMVAAVSWTGYHGGQLTQGENHLTESMPASLRSALGMSATVPAKASIAPSGIDHSTVYGGRIEPILAENCYTCHGPDKQRAGLRLDSYNAIMHGGKQGPVIKSGSAKASELFRRITLPQSDDDAMPPQGNRPLTPDEIQTIQAWINAGAAESAPLSSAHGMPSASVAPVAQVKFPEYDPSAVNAARKDHAADVVALQKHYPNLLEYESRTSAMLVLNAALAGEKFGDSDIAAMKPIFDAITSADFSGTAITDRSAPVLAAMKHLRSLRLSHTQITEKTISQLRSMPELEVISIVGTQVTASSIPMLTSMPKLRRAYVADTSIKPDAANTSALKQELIF